MKRQERLPHNQLVNVAFAAAFTILVLVYVTCIILLEITGSSLLGFSLLFIICMLILGVAWYRSLRNMVTSFMGKVQTLVDNATHGREPTYNYEETLLSSIEHKLMRYIEIARVNGQNLETEKNKIKELISDISHQTKTPLSNIMIYSQLLEESLVNDEHTLQLAVQVKKQSEKLDWLIQSLIKLSRLETGMISLRMEPCPVIRAVSEAVSQILIQAENSRITISINCEPHITACYDPKWTTEVLSNLLENAVKYSEPGGSIHITAEANEMFIRLDIADTGCGISQEELPQIFRRFYRGKNVRDAEGVGIGLFLAREIITAQGGHMKAASVPGQGTVFSIFLPLF